MKTRSVFDNTQDPGYTLRVGLLTYAAVALFTLLAATFVRVTVYPTVRWSLHAQSPNNLPRAFVGSSVTGITMAVIIMAGMTLARRFDQHR